MRWPFSAGKRMGGPAKGQIAETYVFQENQPFDNFF
jgi:hypothetical protein